VLSEQRTEVESLGTPQFVEDDSLSCLVPELKVVLQDAIERTGALRGILEAFGLKVSSLSDASHSAPRLIAAAPIVSTAMIAGRAQGSKLHVGTRSAVQLSAPSRLQNIPVFCHGRQSGLLSLYFPPFCNGLLHGQESDALSREVGSRLARLEIRHWARCQAGLDIPLAGASPSMAQLESEIAKVGAVHYPVVLEAEFGSQCEEFAAAIHVCSPRRHQPFVVVHCSGSRADDFELRLHDAWTRAADGSICISGIDQLDHAAQRQFLHYLSRNRKGRGAARILVSTSVSLSQLTRDGKFCRLLRSELDVLQVRIPPIRERREDLPALLEHFFRKNDFAPRQLSPAAWQACLAYDWPENETELESFAIRVAVMTDSEVLDLPNLHGVAPWLPMEPLQAAAAEPDAWTPSAADEICEENEEPTPSQRQRLESLARKLVAGEFHALEGLCVGMQRALRFVGEHFQEEISLGQLSREAYISVSHLSFLFKRDIGVPFKTLLASVRIEKACQLLLENAQESITEISLDAGFGDLSHFERTFKRLVGTNPRDYRRQQIIASVRAQQV
jgi:AraC-like DNA-binding protein